MTKNEMLLAAANLEKMAAINQMYERKIWETFERTGGKSSANMAPVHAACGKEKLARAGILRDEAAKL